MRRRKQKQDSKRHISFNDMHSYIYTVHFAL